MPAARTVLLSIVLFSCSSCGPARLQTGSTSDASAGAAATADASTPALLQCGIESTTGATLCRAIGACTDTALDPDQFPHCGFRLNGNKTELACACVGSLCTVAPEITCASARDFLASTTELSACANVSEGKCQAAKPTTPLTTTAGDIIAVSGTIRDAGTAQERE